MGRTDKGVHPLVVRLMSTPFNVQVDCKLVCSRISLELECRTHSAIVLFEGTIELESDLDDKGNLRMSLA